MDDMQREYYCCTSVKNKRFIIRNAIKVNIFVYFLKECCEVYVNSFKVVLKKKEFQIFKNKNNKHDK